MELKVSSPKPLGLSPSDCVSDPEEKEVSDDDDDDRNHKHRRRETRSQSLERDAPEHVITRPYRRRNKPYENGHAFRDFESQASEKDLYTKFERRRPGLMPLARSPLDLNQRIRANQTFSGDTGPGRGRGRDSGSWNQRDSRFSSVDIASQMVQQGSIPPSLYNGRGLPNVSNAQSASWSAFGLIPGLPTGGLDTIHSIGLQGTLRPPINSSMNMGIPRQRCRDFEERGFCLRGDMCPMEHGVNRIVIEDVQSLSQFNLPVSLPNVHLLGAPAGTGPLPSVSASSTALMNSKGLHGKSSKPGMADDGLGLNGAFPGSGCVNGADLYDPDQPLWNNNGPETSSALLSLQSPKIHETDSTLNDDPSDRHLGRLCDSADNECLVRSTGTGVGSQGTSLSVWGRIGSSKNRLDVKGKIDSTMSSSDYLENEAKEDKGTLASVQGTSRQGKRIIAEDVGPKAMDSSPKTPSDNMRNIRKPSQKALRTLFVNGIPQRNNKREALLSHFQKFGEVVDIYIPANGERAFVQFSKREEAEAALKAPDAVMGNRFIKLWWANRDSIPDDGISSGSSVSVTPHGVTAASASYHPSIVSKGKDINQPAASRSSVLHASDASVSVSDHPKPVISDAPKAPPPLQKKLESLEQLKEELRKKQELLDQKRNDFRRQLQKLEKHATKGEVVAEQVAKRPKVEIAADIAKAATPRSSYDPGSAVVSPHTEMVGDKIKSVDNVLSHSPKASTPTSLQESTNLKQPNRLLAPVGAPFLMNRYKLDNRPTGFRIIPPLPAGLASVAVLKEHFSSYGDLSTVELEDIDVSESEASKICSACITFTTRRSAERAFVNGKCWQDHNLKFMWLTSSNSRSDSGGSENSPSTHKGHSEPEIQPAETYSEPDIQPAETYSEPDVQPAETLPSIVSEEVTASENGDPEGLERKSGVEHMELGEDSQPGASPKSGEEE
ncbi:zinc finger CCCH domain-containing protein 41 [Castanea sativa]|uniref:zinc finger CCCH domain-containing protein 41 n=1 Tax=Castanea sativa TaxID=21020 RepID=UPI003F652D4C